MEGTIRDKVQAIMQGTQAVATRLDKIEELLLGQHPQTVGKEEPQPHCIGAELDSAARSLERALNISERMQNLLTSGDQVDALPRDFGALNSVGARSNRLG